MSVLAAASRGPRQILPPGGRVQILLGVALLVLLAACDAPGPLPPAATPTMSAALMATAAADPTLRDRVARQVDVGGHKLWLDCYGQGRPVVVLEAGLGTGQRMWQGVQPTVGGSTRVCSYDRAGLGNSESGPPPRTSAVMVQELHAMLTAAQVPPPYVLVGHAFGGLNVQLYAGTYPQEVAAIVLVDSQHPDQIHRFEAVLTPDQVRTYEADLESNFEHVKMADLLASGAQVQAAGLPDVPLIVLRHGLPPTLPEGWPVAAFEQMWTEMQTDLAARTPHGQLRVAEHSGHNIPLEQRLVVIEAIQAAIAAARQP